MKDKKRRTKNPNGIVYFIIFIIIYPLFRILFKLEVDRRGYEKPKKSCVVLCNHQSYMDFLLVVMSLYPRRLNGVAAQKFFFAKPLDKFLPFMGAIPKSLFEPDVRSAMAIMDVIKRGNSLLLFPEGRITNDGTYGGVHKSTGKLIKKLGVPVVSCTVEGAYICMPFWRKGFKRGNLRVTLSNLISAEDTKTLTVDEVNHRINDCFSKADTIPSEERFYVISSKKLAEGIEKILYLCPCCSREFTLESMGNFVWCTVCGSAAEMDRFAKFRSAENKGDGSVRAANAVAAAATPISDQTGDKPLGVMPKSLQEWYKLQVAHEMESLSEDMEPIVIPVMVKVSTVKAGGLISIDRGVLKLDSKGWHYDGELGGETIAEFFPIDTVPALPFDPYVNFQIYAKNRFHAFLPVENPKACIKYVIMGECAYHRFAQDMQMTKPLNTQHSTL